MLYYAKVINEKTKECLVPNQIEAKANNFEKLDVEIGYNGKFYLKDYVPTRPIDEIKEEVRAIRDKYLLKTDFTQLADAPFTKAEKQKYAEYREYLRNYPETENWWENNPLTFEEWLQLNQ